MSKTIGYVIAGIGLAGLALTTSTATAKSILGETLGTQASSTIGLGICIVLVAVGIIMAMGDSSGSKNKNQKGQEIPIYEGKNIVGYRKLTEKEVKNLNK